MSKKHKKSWLATLSLRTKVIIIASVLGVIAAITLTIWLIRINQPASTDNSNTTITQGQIRHQQVEQRVKRDNAIRDSAAEALEKGGTDKASQVYSDAIAAEKDVVHKIQLTIDQSLFLYNAGQYDQAVKVAKDAENYSDDKYLIADWLSQLYETGQQYSLAAQYYTLAGKWASSDTNTSRQTKAYYDSQAARVSALIGKR